MPPFRAEQARGPRQARPLRYGICGTRGVLFAICVLAAAAPPALTQTPSWLDAYREPAGRIIAAATSNQDAWQRLAELTDTFGPRLSGSPQLNAAIEWAAAEMKKD